MNFSEFLRAKNCPQFRHSAGDWIIDSSNIEDNWYFIEAGRVRFESESQNPDSETILGYASENTILNADRIKGLFQEDLRIAADSEVILRKIGNPLWEEFCSKYSRNAFEFFKQTINNFPRLESFESSKLDEMLEQSLKAQKKLENWMDDRVNELILSVSKIIEENTNVLAMSSVLEGKRGNANDRIQLMRFVCNDITKSIVKSPNYDFHRSGRIEFHASAPAGVIAAALPATNPLPFALFVVLITLKSRNSVIFHVPANAEKTVYSQFELIRNTLRIMDAPPELVQWTEPKCGRNEMLRLFSHSNVSMILTFNGKDGESAARCTGKPAFSARQECSPVWVCKDADLDLAAESIVTSKSFDNGLLPFAETALIVDSEIRQPFVEALQRNGAAVLNPAEEYLFTTQIMDPSRRKFKSNFNGHSAKTIARLAGIRRPYEVKLIVVSREFLGPDQPYCQPNRSPIIPMFRVEEEAEAILLSSLILGDAKAPGIISIHTRDLSQIEKLFKIVSADRIVVNGGTVQTSIGMTGKFEPSLMPGCKTGGSPFNLTPDHLTIRKQISVSHVSNQTNPALRESDRWRIL